MELPDQAYSRWLADPSPGNMTTVLDSLSPAINSEIQRYKGPKPLLRTQAKQLAIGAVKTYNPAAGAKLNSWVVTQLQPLTRYGRDLSTGVHYSELAYRQAAEVEAVRRRFLEEHDSDPTDDQIADEIGISATRVRKVRDQVRPVLSEGAFESDLTGEGVLPSVSEEKDPALATAVEMVYAGLDARDRSIFDYKTGYYGKDVISNQDLAKRLGVTPAFISQRSALITQQIMETRNRV